MRYPFLLLLALLAACDREQAAAPASPGAPEIAAVIEAQVAPLPDTDWALHGNDYREQRFSPLAQINRDNVQELGLAWSFDMYTQRGVEATPWWWMASCMLPAVGPWSTPWMRATAS